MHIFSCSANANISKKSDKQRHGLIRDGNLAQVPQRIFRNQKYNSPGTSDIACMCIVSVCTPHQQLFVLVSKLQLQSCVNVLFVAIDGNMSKMILSISPVYIYIWKSYSKQPLHSLSLAHWNGSCLLTRCEARPTVWVQVLLLLEWTCLR